MATPQIDARLALDSSAFTRGMMEASNLTNKFIGVAAAATAALSAFFSIRGAANLVKEQMAVIDSTAKLADRLGTTTEALIGLEHAADLAGVSSEQLATASTMLNKKIAEAAEGSKTAVDAFSKLHISYIDLLGLPIDKQMELIAEKMSGLKTSSEKTALAMDLFGRSGAGLINLLQEGSGAIKSAQVEAEKLGLTFSRIDAAKVEAANDALATAGKSLNALSRGAAIELAPLIYGISDALIESAKSAGGLGKVFLGMADSVVYGIGVIYDAFNILSTAWNSGAAGIKIIGLAFLSVTNDVWKYIRFWGQSFGNFVDYLSEVGSFIKAAFEAPLTAVKVVVVEFVKFTMDNIVWLLSQAASVAGIVSSSLEEEINSFSSSIAGATELGYNAIVKNASETEKKLFEISGRTKEAFVKILDTKDGLADSEAINTLYDKLEESAESSAVAFSNSFNKVLTAQGSNSVSAWWEDVKRTAEVKAEEISQNAAKRIDEQRVESEAQKAEALARENEHNQMLYTNTMYWANETWTALKNGWDKSGQEINASRSQSESWFTEFFLLEGQKRRKWDQLETAEKVERTRGYLATTATLMNSHSKRMFQIGKAAAIANAVISTAQGAASALKDVPFPYNIAAMAAVIAAGAVQISTIASTQFGGGGSVSSAGGSVALINGEPSGVLATQQPGVTGNSVNRLEVSISGLSDDAVLSGAQVRNLIQQINDAQSDGARIDDVTVRAA